MGGEEVRRNGRGGVRRNGRGGVRRNGRCVCVCVLIVPTVHFHAALTNPADSLVNRHHS